MKETLEGSIDKLGIIPDDIVLLDRYISVKEKFRNIFNGSYQKNNWIQRHILKGRITLGKRSLSNDPTISFNQETRQGLMKISFILIESKLAIAVQSFSRYLENYFFIPGEDGVFRRICIDSEIYREDNLVNDADREELLSYFNTFDLIYSKISPE